MQGDRVADPGEALEGLCGGAPDHAVDLVALLEEQLGEVGAVLAGDSRDERARRVVHAERELRAREGLGTSANASRLPPVSDPLNAGPLRKPVGCVCLSG